MRILCRPFRSVRMYLSYLFSLHSRSCVTSRSSKRTAGRLRAMLCERVRGKSGNPVQGLCKAIVPFSHYTTKSSLTDPVNFLPGVFRRRFPPVLSLSVCIGVLANTKRLRVAGLPDLSADLLALPGLSRLPGQMQANSPECRML